jgi:hypothetical protein
MSLTMTNATRHSPSARLRLPALAVLSALAVLCSPAPASAADTAPLFAGTFGGYWQGFVEFWSGTFKKQNGVVMFALLVGALSLFIITRGKWRK